MVGQLVFDSKDYSFPPDIIFQNLPDPLISTDLSTLLPLKDWNLENENCLYNWVERIVKFFDKVVCIKPTRQFLKNVY